MARPRRSSNDEPLLEKGTHTFSDEDPIPAGIHIRSRRSITVKFPWQGRICTETYRLRPTESNVKHVAELLEDIRNSIGKNTFCYEMHFPNSKQLKKVSAIEVASKKTCGELLAEWLAGRRKIKLSMKAEYLKIVNGQLMPVFGTKKISDLADSDINAFRDALKAKGNSLSRIRNVLSPLRGATRRALRQHIITSDPFELVEPYGNHELSAPQADADDDDSDCEVWFQQPLPDSNLAPVEEPEGKPDPLSPAEREAILSQMEGQVRNFFALSFWTGMRTGEVIALCWCDIDWVNLRVCVRRSKRGKYISTPKTRSGIRWVPLTLPAIAALRAQESFTKAEGRWVFHNPRTGRVWSSDNKTRVYWDAALESANVAPRWQYQTRHSYASTLLSSGENPLFVAKNLGHRDWHMLVQVYGRWIPQVNQAAGSLVEQMCRDEWMRTATLLQTLPPAREEGGRSGS